MKIFATALLAFIAQASQEMMIENEAETFIAEKLASLSGSLEEPSAGRKLSPSTVGILSR